MAYNDYGLANLTAACDNWLRANSHDSETHAAVLRCLAHWEAVRAKRVAEPYDPDARQEYGNYVNVRVSRRPSSDEWTNVGVLLYGTDEKLLGHLIGPFDRAVRRGDIDQDGALDYVRLFPSRYDTLGCVRQLLGSTGHFMSCVQLTAPRGSVAHEDVLWSIYQKDVLGVH